MTGGAPISLAAATNPYGASWAEDGMIYYGQGPEGIWRVSENGGDPENVISIDSGQLAHGPQLLPGGEWVLFTEATGSAWNDGSIVAESLATGNRVVLIQGGTEGRYVPTGHIVYVRDGTLFAVPFDLGAMEVTSGPASMVEGVRTAAANFTGAANYALTSGGGLVYVQGAAGGTAVTLVWVNRESNVEPLSFEPRGYLRPRISPEEDRIAVQIVDAEGTHIWILDIETSTSQRLTFEGTNQYPVWAPDGEWVYFDSDRGGDSDIWKRRTDLSADAEPVYQAEGLQYPYSISGDGTVRLFGDQGAGNWDIQMLPLDGDSEPTMPENTDAETLYPWISPDGRWLAFQSNETGSLRIHVREIETGRRRTISTGFGTYPVWSRDGTEIIYRPGGGQRSVVEVTREPELSFSAPRPLFEVAGFQVQNDVSADGQRFLGVLPAGTVETAGESASPRINVVLNWFEELKQRVPTGREQ